MKIFKFGGASVKDAASVENVFHIMKNHSSGPVILVVSAMGKTTNALENVVHAYFRQEEYADIIKEIKSYHTSIASALFPQKDSVFSDLSEFFDDIESFLRRNKSPNYDFVYDQVVSCGELISSKILCRYLCSMGWHANWLDARDYLKTDASYRQGKLDWAATEKNIQTLDLNACYVTQGFIASDENFFTVTLGREGSDYSAAIFAYCTNADEMLIWKDVPGVMTADPRLFPDASLIETLSYEDAIEMAYYGASVIHPKTLQPLKKKNIAFSVRSFLNPETPGSRVVAEKPTDKESLILKKNQQFFRIATRDFSFITEEHMADIFSLLYELKLSVTLLQSSAISLNLCIEDRFGKTEAFRKTLESKYRIQHTPDVSLLTIRNPRNNTWKEITQGKNVLLKQSTEKNYQIIYI